MDLVITNANTARITREDGAIGAPGEILGEKPEGLEIAAPDRSSRDFGIIDGA